jgi:hypothetical protein
MAIEEVLEGVIEEAVLNTSDYIPEGLDPVVSVVRGFFVIMSSILGGLFGLYFIFLLMRFFYERKVLRQIQLLHKKIDHIEKKLKVHARAVHKFTTGPKRKKR